jgi:hypothetical protein
MWNLNVVGFVGVAAQSTPDPVTPGTPGFTWDIEVASTPPQESPIQTYASTSLSKVVFGGDTLSGGTQFIQGLFSGIVEYHIRDWFGNVSILPVGQQDPDGVVPAFLDEFVTSVTFGWGVSTVSVGEANIHMEVWQSS